MKNPLTFGKQSSVVADIERYVDERIGILHEEMEDPKSNVDLQRGAIRELRQLISHIKSNTQ